MSPAFQDPNVLVMQWIFVAVFAMSGALALMLKIRASSYMLASLPMLALASHQMEEYLVSPLLLGHDNHFLNWAFAAGFYISPTSVVTVNLLGYLGSAALFLCRPSSLVFAFVFLFISAMTFANGVFHIGVATLQSSYSPGMLTSLLMFMPLYLKSVLNASEHGVSFMKLCGLSAYGFIAH